MTYHQRCLHYFRQRGLSVVPYRFYYEQLTPKQRRRAFKKERQTWRRRAYE